MYGNAFSIDFPFLTLCLFKKKILNRRKEVCMPFYLLPSFSLFCKEDLKEKIGNKNDEKSDRMRNNFWGPGKCKEALKFHIIYRLVSLNSFILLSSYIKAVKWFSKDLFPSSIHPSIYRITNKKWNGIFSLLFFDEFSLQFLHCCKFT